MTTTAAEDISRCPDHARRCNCIMDAEVFARENWRDAKGTEAVWGDDDAEIREWAESYIRNGYYICGHCELDDEHQS